MANPECDHLWKPNGPWDGKTEGGTPISGVMLKCTKCPAKATSQKEALQKGGSMLKGDFDIFGNDLNRERPGMHI